MIALFGKKQIRFRSNTFGTTIAELPAGLSIIFIGICMPLLCLVLTAARFALFWEAAREASDAACQAQTYVTTSYTTSTPTPTNGTTSSTTNTTTGAVTLAQNAAVNVSSMFPGVSVSPDDVNCYIVVTPLNSSSASVVYGPNTVLTTAPDPTTNLYQLRVDVSGQIQAVFPLPSSIFGNIPGLTEPLAVKLSTLRVLDNPQGAYAPPSTQ